MEQNQRKKKIPKWCICLAIFLALALAAGAVAFLLLNRDSGEPEAKKNAKVAVLVTLFGDSEITLEYGDPFLDPGALGQWWYEEEPQQITNMEVQVDSNLDLKKTGTYTITYSAEYKGTRDTKTRTVHITDTKAPQITLTADPDHYTLPGKEYQEEGFTAADNYDGDITQKVERRVEDGKVYYSVTDSAGNRAEAVREIVYKDPEPPKLTLKGETAITLTAGTKWTEPGYSASDNADGDITKRVKVKGSVDSYRAGKYELTYEVSDSFGNKTTAKRTVVVEAIRQPEVVDPEGKVIYLTFDDGPSKYTEKLLGILEKYNVKATFFVCKTGQADVLKDIAAGGHAIGMHSISHRYEEIYASEDAFFKDLYAAQDYIFEYTGLRPTLMRFPGGSSNSISKKINKGIMTKLTQAVQDQGFQYVDWDVDSHDASDAKTTDEVANNVINGISKSKRDHFVVLQHDIKGYSVDAVERIIVWGLANGYTFQALDATSPVCHHHVNN